VTLDELRARIGEIVDELRAIDTEAGDQALTEDQQARFDELLKEREERQGEIEAIELRNVQRAQVEALARQPRHEHTIEPGDGARHAAPNVIIRDDPFAVLEDRSLHGRHLERALVDANLRAMEAREIGGAANERHFERTLKRHGKDTRWAANILARGSDAYLEGWKKMVTGREAFLEPEERAAMAVGTNTAGGFLVPSFLDPTLLLTNDGSSNVMRQYATVRTLTIGNQWKGVTSAGATASWDAELTEVSDDTPAVAQPTIDLEKPQSLLLASIEAFDDIDGLTSDALMIFADARDRLEGAGHMTGAGSGSNEPTGLFTAINASSSLQVTSTTAATIGLVDIHAAYRALPVRFRGRGSWVCNPLYSLAVKSLGATGVSSSYSGDLRDPVTSRWLDKPVVETDDAPSTQTTTALDQEIVFADLSEYVIVDKPGSASIEFIPHMLGSNRRPNGSRGFYMYWRTGGGMPRIEGGRILVDKTSAG
jgi:HK97 family phage major capsid protein